MRHFIYFVVLLFATVTVQAQPPMLQQQMPQQGQPQQPPMGGGQPMPQPQERIVELDSLQMTQIEHILKLEGRKLTTFRDLYKQYLVEIKKAHPEREFNREIKRSDKEIEESIKESFAQAKLLIEIQERFYYKFREILSPREVSAMYEIERRIRERVQYELRIRESEGQQGQPRQQGQQGQSEQRR